MTEMLNCGAGFWVGFIELFVGFIGMTGAET